MNVRFKNYCHWLCCCSNRHRQSLESNDRSEYGSLNKKETNLTKRLRERMVREIEQGLKLINKLKNCINFGRLYQEHQEMIRRATVYFNENESKQIECSNKTIHKSIISVTKENSSNWNGFELRMEGLIKLYKTNNLEIDNVMKNQLTHLVNEMTEMDSGIINRDFIHKIETFKHDVSHDLI